MSCLLFINGPLRTNPRHVRKLAFLRALRRIDEGVQDDAVILAEF